MSSGRLGNLLTGVLTICAILVTAAVVKKEFFPTSRKPPTARHLDDAAPAFLAGNSMGSPDAPVTFLVFSDFQCPFCVLLQQNIKSVLKRHPTAVRVVYRHMPIENLHPFAFDAAIASECAGEQGRFAEYHDALFETQDSIPKERWDWFAVEAGVPSATDFAECVSSRRTEPRVRADMDQAERFRLTGTPSVIVGDTLLPGTPSTRVLDSIVRVKLPAVRSSASGR